MVVLWEYRERVAMPLYARESRPSCPAERIQSKPGQILLGEADWFIPRLGIEASKWKFRLNDSASKKSVPGPGGARLEQKSGRISISGDPLSPSKR